MRLRRVAAALLTAALAWVSAGAALPAADLTLTVDGDHLCVNGQAKFLVFASYFDALDAPDANIRRDFAQFKAWGVDGVRILPNWWTDSPPTYPGDTLIDPEGSIRESVFRRLVWCLDRAREYGLLVDVSFNRESIAALCAGKDCPSNEDHASLSVDGYTHGLRETASKLAGTGNRHVLIDIQNESNLADPHQHLGDADVASIVAALKAVDPSLVVTASVDQNCGGSCAGARANRTNQDVVASHEPRTVNFWRETSRWVKDLRGHTAKPIYLQEPERFRSGTRGDDGGAAGWNADWLTAAGLIEAVTQAKRAGAAAWTFHTSAGFFMNVPASPARGYPGGDFLDQLRGPEGQFLRSFKAAVDAAPWGARTATTGHEVRRRGAGGQITRPAAPAG